MSNTARRISEFPKRRQRGGRVHTIQPAPMPADVEGSPIWEFVPGIDGGPPASGYTSLLRRDAIFRRSLAFADLFAALLALAFACRVIHPGQVQLHWTAVLLAPFVVLVSKAIGLYDRDQHILHKTTIDEIPPALHLAIAYALGAWLAQGVLFTGVLDRSQVFALAVADFALMLVSRGVVRKLTLAVTEPERCIVLGNAADARRISEKLEASSSVRAVVIGRVALRGDEVRPVDGVDSAPALAELSGLARVIAQHGVERVVIAPGSHDEEEILHAIRLVKALGAKVSVRPRLLEVVGSSSIFDEVDGMTLLGVRHYGLSKSSEFLKRMVDLVAAGLGIMALAPLLTMIALAVRLDSRGPIFFRQPRIGRRGELFSMLKFRSMVVDAEQIKGQLRERNEAGDGLFKIGDDPRITRVGRLIRRTSLDELPQLFNVLRGDMSLVGPRPLVPDEDALIEGWKRRRLAVKPGMTGLWQVFGSSRIPMNEMVKIDYLYGANWSIWLDIKILLRTVPYVLSRRGR
jgi:exopolysaccharide biosynthesis polyprenyl glycosylphosphotransferase